MLRRFVENREGNFAAIFTIAMLPVAISVGGALDYFSAVNKGSTLQNALDAAGLGAAQELLAGMPESRIREVGADFLAANSNKITVAPEDFFITSTSFASVYGDWDNYVGTAFTDPSEYVLVKGQIEHETLVRSFGNWKISRHAVVQINRGLPACVLALDRNASSAIKVQGSTQTRLQGCVMSTNSVAENAFYRGGSAILEAECVLSSGGSIGLDSSNAKLNCDAPLHRQMPSMDPLRNVQVPSYDSCKSVPNGQVKTLSPGTYCDQNISGKVTLTEGVYILRGGQFKLGGNGSLTGHGVTIFLTEGAEISIGANQVVDLSPPSEGTYAGITIFQAPGNTKTVSLLGTAGSNLSGFIYAPDAHLIYAGNNSMTGAGSCLRLVARTIEMTGNSDVSSDCAAELGGRKMQAGQFIGLVQ